MKKRLAKMTASLAKKAAKSACGSASNFYVYQAKEPKKLKELLK